MGPSTWMSKLATQPPKHCMERSVASSLFAFLSRIAMQHEGGVREEDALPCLPALASLSYSQSRGSSNCSSKGALSLAMHLW